MVREVRESGSKPSSGNDSLFTSLIHNLSKEELSPKAPFNEPTSLEHLRIVKFTRFDGKPPSGKDSSLGQSSIRRLLRDGSSICMFLGNDSNLDQFLSVI